MKKIIKIALIAAALVTSTGVFAQKPPLPNGGNGPLPGATLRLAAAHLLVAD